jgi:chemotaxis protein methyltransferase CheR
MDHLVRLLINKEAYFFREMRQFEVLRDQVLPEVLASGEQPLRIWSAGCGAGEEPYSLAISLLEYQAAHGAFEAEIVATDIDLLALSEARERCYSLRAVRRVPDDLLEKYFTFDGQTYWLIPEVARLVSFAMHNLVRDDRPAGLGNLDIVFCRNVTIYLAEWARDHVNSLLADSLRDGGYLFVASAEAMAHNLGRLEPILTGQTMLFKKQELAAISYSSDAGTDALLRAARSVPPDEQSPAEPSHPSMLDVPKADEQLVTPASQAGAPLARKGRLVRVPQDQSAGEKARRPLPPSLEELVAQAQDRVRAWSQRSSPSQELVGGWTDSRNLEQYRVILDRARRAYQQQDYDAALCELEQLPEGVPIWTEAYCLRSVVLFHQGRLEETEVACQTMLAHDPWYADAHFMLGLVFRQQGLVDEAIRSLEQAIDLEPSHRYAHFFLAEIHRGFGRFAQARNEYENTLSILGQFGEPPSELSLPGLDDEALREACEVKLEEVRGRLAES